MSEQGLNNPVVKTLLNEFGHGERMLEAAADDLLLAKAKFTVTSKKYAAVRDMILDLMDSDNPDQAAINMSPAIRESFRKGRYRFIHMSAGDAVLEALKESSEPVKLEQIMNILVDGGYGYATEFGPRASSREVNAALINKASVGKTKDGKYFFVEPEDENVGVEELPF